MYIYVYICIFIYIINIIQVLLKCHSNVFWLLTNSHKCSSFKLQNMYLVVISGWVFSLVGLVRFWYLVCFRDLRFYWFALAGAAAVHCHLVVVAEHAHRQAIHHSIPFYHTDQWKSPKAQRGHSLFLMDMPSWHGALLLYMHTHWD